MTDDEELPLLHSERVRVQAPFPWFQFTTVFALQTAGYLTVLATNPFILMYLIRNIGIAEGEKNVGYYVGFLTSTIYVAETATTFYFCRLSDYIGRKPVFLASIIGLAVCICGFGLSTTFLALLFWQALIGGLDGTYGLTRGMLAEMVDPADIARAFAYNDISYYFAGTIGGSLSRPVEQFPGLFGSSEFFKTYPYFLPCAVCSVLIFVAWLAGNYILERNSANHLYLRKRGPKVLSELSSLLLPGVIIAATNLAAISLVERFYGSTEALYLSTPIKDGGLGFSPRAIGTYSSFSAIVIGISQLFIFPRMHDKWGSRYVCILGASASLPRFVLWPVMNWIAKRDGNSNNILVLYQSVAGVLRALGPAVSNSLFSLSIDKGYLGGYLVYFVFVCSSVIALCAASFLPRDRVVTNTRKSVI
ncbi:member of major facilitator superfamily multidrug-resistance, DHA1 sub-family [Amanita rubescens]|nr:member of major facilitator superfamily multidrug-resistance, DHA1 sub-family [Amanita rubescens]